MEPFLLRGIESFLLLGIEPFLLVGIEPFFLFGIGSFLIGLDAQRLSNSFLRSCRMFEITGF